MIMNAAIFFGHYVIVTAALDFQYGNAGIPNMSNNLSVACGAYVVSSLVQRISMWILTFSGLAFRPDWVYDNPYNATAITAFSKTHPFLSLSLYLFSLGLALVIGSLLGGFIASISGSLRATYLMMLLYVISDAGGLIAANNPWIAGGTMGAFIPNFLSWYPGENMLIVALTTIIVGLVCFLIIRTMQNSPFGRLMRAVRDNEWTLRSVAKNVAKIRREVMMFSSGMMAVTGVLIAFYYNFVEYQFYDRNTYTFWPWLMITIGGTGNIAGSLLGVIICVSLLKGISIFNLVFGEAMAETGRANLFLTLENTALAVLLIFFITYWPRGLIPERTHYIRGINYREIIQSEGQGPSEG